MTTPDSQPVMETDSQATKPCLKILGVGNAGMAMAEAIMARGFSGAAFGVVNADSRALRASTIEARILVEKKMLRGMGTGGDPERARAAAEEHLQKLKEACAGVDVALILVGLGGGAGTGITPVLARAARDAGALTLVLATLPFECEGNRRQQQALDGLDALKESADGVICLPNQRVFKLIDESTSLVDTFRKSSELVGDVARGIGRLLIPGGLIELHLDDVRGLMKERVGESRVAVAEAEGPGCAAEAVAKLFAHPLLDGDSAPGDADGVIVGILGGPELAMKDIHGIMAQVNERCANAQVVMGATIDEAYRDKIAVTLITTGGRRAIEVAVPPRQAFNTNEQFLDKEASPRPASRFVPPATTIGPEQQAQLLNKQNGGRGKRLSPRMKQAQLPLEIVSRGRFEKSEPTIHKGEDLDVPTFIRRGVALN